MAGFAPDAGCMVAAVCAWHEHHGRARGAIARRLRRGERLLLPLPALVEAYAVLTRLPPPHRLTPREALTLLEANFVRPGRLLALDGRGYLDLLRRAADREIAGGRTYDALVAACVLKVPGAVLVTLDGERFEPFAREGLRVAVAAPA